VTGGAGDSTMVADDWNADWSSLSADGEDFRRFDNGS